MPIFSAFHLYFSSSIDQAAARGGDTWPPRAPAAGYITATGPLQCCSAAELHRPATDLAAMLDNTTASLFV